MIGSQLDRLRDRPRVRNSTDPKIGTAITEQPIPVVVAIGNTAASVRDMAFSIATDRRAGAVAVSGDFELGYVGCLLTDNGSTKRCRR